MNDGHLVRDADAYFLRNRDSLEPEFDPVLRELERVHARRPIKRLLELGCANGWRLHQASVRLGCSAMGIELSERAVADGHSRFPDVELLQGLVPDALEAYASEAPFDCVIVGFLMYVLPRDRLFRLAAAVDGALAENGMVLAYDFLHPSAVRSPYAHNDHMTVYKHDPSAPWTWSPTYALVGRHVERLECEPSQWIAVDVIRKLSVEEAYEVVPAPPSRHSKGPSS